MSILPIIDPEFRGLIPPLSPEEREQLEQNIIQSRKIYDPIILWEGIILDGHNRFEICIKHAIEFELKEIPLGSREEAKVWIIENQLNRRNLSDVARIEMALLKAELLREKAKKNLTRGGRPQKDDGKPLSVSSKPKIEPVHVQKATAANAGVGEEKLYNYLQIKEQGSPELQAKVQSGEIKIGTAHRLLTKEILKQLRVGDRMLKSIRKSIPEEDSISPDPELHSQMANLATVLRELLDKLAKGGDNNHEVA